MGLSTQGFGTVCQWAVVCLNALTGNLDREGGVLFTEPAIDFVTTGLIGRGHYDLYRSRVSDAPEYGGELPVSVFAEEIETPGEGQVRAVLTIAGNPVLSTPDGKRLGAALETLDFMAAVDIYVNETTRHADVILPPTTILERDHYDIAFQGLAVRNTARFTPAVFDKPRDARHDWQIFRELALRIAVSAGPHAVAPGPPPPATAAAAHPDVRDRRAAAPGWEDLDHRAPQASRGRRPRSAAADPPGPAADAGPTDRPGAGADPGRSRPGAVRAPRRGPRGCC